MKNKLTNNILKQMIKEVLSEGKIFIRDSFKDLSDGPHDTRSGSDRKKLGFQVSTGDFKKMADLAGIGKDKINALNKDQVTKILKKATEINGLTISNDDTTQAFFASPEPEEEPKAEPPEEEPFKMEDPLGSFTISNVGFPIATGNANEPQNIVLNALKTAFTGISPSTIQAIAALDIERSELVPNFLNEDRDKLELEDLAVLFKLNPDEKLSGQKAFLVAKAVEGALGDYIDVAVSGDVPGLTRSDLVKLSKVKKTFNYIVTKELGYNPAEDEAGYLPDMELPRANQVEKQKEQTSKLMNMNPETVNLFVNFFSGANNIKERINRLNQLSSKIISGQGEDPRLEDIAFGAPIIKMMESYFRGMDSTAAGTEIEGLLALMVGGKKIGGASGAGDFSGSDGTEYSLKTFADSSGISQASLLGSRGVIRQNPNQKQDITYVFIRKMQQVDGDLKGIGITKSGSRAATPKIKAGASGYRKVLATQVYAVRYVYWPKGSNQEDVPGLNVSDYKSGKTKKPIFAAYKPNASTNEGDLIGYVSRSGKSPDVFHSGDLGAAIGADETLNTRVVSEKLKGTDCYLGTIRIVDTEDSTFLENYKTFVDESAAEPIKILSSIYKQTQKIANSSRELFADKDLATGFDISSSYSFLKEDLVKLVDYFLGDNASREILDLSENKNKKKSKKDLDILIEQVILKRLLK